MTVDLHTNQSELYSRKKLKSRLKCTICEQIPTSSFKKPYKRRLVRPIDPKLKVVIRKAKQTITFYISITLFFYKTTQFFADPQYSEYFWFFFNYSKVLKV